MTGRMGLAGAALLLAGCAGVPATSVPLTGQWGGTHVGLVLSEIGGTAEYDCAAGTIGGPVLVAPGGNFSAAGRHTPAAGGPDRVGETRPSFGARYQGRVRGDRMTLQVRVENGVTIGPYALRRGAEPVLFRCL